MADLPPLRYLARDDVLAAMPPLDERLRLAESVMRGLAGGAELPPKIGLHPRPDASFAHAMPAFLRGAADDGSADQLGMKWVLGFGGNAALGLPSIHGQILLNHPTTGVPLAIVDAGPVTAERTAAVTGVAIRAFAPAIADRAPRAALVGAGVQGHSHLPVLGHTLPGVELAIFDRHPDRAESLAAVARSTDGIAKATVAPDARFAVLGADVVVTAASFTGAEQRQVMTPDWLAPHALVVPVDYATMVAAAVAHEAALFLVDHREQFLANRAAGNFDGYPDPSMTLGEALVEAVQRPADGRVVVTHLGVGLSDVVFGVSILGEAERRGLGTVLPR
jgi:ornithine cyclodeaminase/alanine dehydrogenase-like protein (mu-crystallin family)